MQIFPVITKEVTDLRTFGGEDDTCNSDTGQLRKGRQSFAVRINPRDCIDTRNRVYLVLGTPLGDDETPEFRFAAARSATRLGTATGPFHRRTLRTGSRPRSRSKSMGDVRRTGVRWPRKRSPSQIASGERLSSGAAGMVGDVRHTGKITSSPSTVVAKENRQSLTARTPGKATSTAPTSNTQVAAIIVRARTGSGMSRPRDDWLEQGRRTRTAEGRGDARSCQAREGRAVGGVRRRIPRPTITIQPEWRPGTMSLWRRRASTRSSS